MRYSKHVRTQLTSLPAVRLQYKRVKLTISHKAVGKAYANQDVAVVPGSDGAPATAVFALGDRKPLSFVAHLRRAGDGSADTPVTWAPKVRVLPVQMLTLKRCLQCMDVPCCTLHLIMHVYWDRLSWSCLHSWYWFDMSTHRAFLSWHATTQVVQLKLEGCEADAGSGFFSGLRNWHTIAVCDLDLTPFASSASSLPPGKYQSTLVPLPWPASSGVYQQVWACHMFQSLTLHFEPRCMGMRFSSMTMEASCQTCSPVLPTN